MPRANHHGSGWTWQTRRCQDLVILCATVVLVSTSLYHACSLREVSHQHTVRAKVLSRSYLGGNSADGADIITSSVLGGSISSGSSNGSGGALLKDRLALERSDTGAATGRLLQPGAAAGSQDGAAVTNGLNQLLQQQQQQQQPMGNRQQQQQQVAVGTVVDITRPVKREQQQQQQPTQVLNAGGTKVERAADGGIGSIQAAPSRQQQQEQQQQQPAQRASGMSLGNSDRTSSGGSLSDRTASGSSLPSAGVANSADQSSSTSSGGSSSGTFAFAADASAGGSTTGQTEPQPSIPGLPPDFDWKVYLLYHPDLATRGITTKEEAIDHYLNYGQHEGRIYSRLSVLVRYSACGGLTNQLYSHIASLSLAATLGAEAVLPPALTRSSFGHYFSMFKELNQVSWSAVPLESLFDVESLVDHWKGQGLILHKTPPLVAFPDMAAPEVAYLRYDMPGINEAFVVQMPDVYQNRMPLSQLVEKARAAVVGHAQTIKRLEPSLDVKYIVLDLPCTFFMLSHLSELEIAQEAARSLHFAPSMVALADKVVDGILRDGAAAYNGIHLRLESDSRDWSAILGGRDAFWDAYVAAIQQAGFDARTKLYAATGLLSYGAEDEMSSTLRTLTDSGWASSVVYKEMYLSREDLEGLSSEQKALVDFIVLTRARTVVGLGSSTFSYYLREYRALNGFRKGDTVLADASRIGTDAMFHECGTITA